ncbi:ABC transporter permease, partial [Listeria monocytogenes]|nr:ABC transporter permease [Listeria monocytogenes]
MNGLLWGLGNTNDQQANQSANGIRVCLSPRNKFIVSLANLLASFVLFYAQTLIVVATFHFIYGVEFGSHW